MRHIIPIAGVRPNFMKIAPLIHAIQKAEDKRKDIHYRFVHTGQHYGTNPDNVKPALDKLFANQWKKSGIPPLGEGHAAKRIIDIIENL